MPKLDKTICSVLGGPIMWSSKDTQETINQIEIKHNAVWLAFGCKEVA